MSRPLIHITFTKPADARGWIGLGCYSLVVIVLIMIAADKHLLESDAFLILATAIIVSGWNGGPVGWAYQGRRRGGGKLGSYRRSRCGCFRCEQASTKGHRRRSRPDGGSCTN
jgi:hypothetical protein